MAVERTIRCDLCRDQLETGVCVEPSRRPVGIHWQSWPAGATGWIEKPWRETDRHICAICLSSLQAMPQRCGQGFQCDGGPRCPSDHK